MVFVSGKGRGGVCNSERTGRRWIQVCRLPLSFKSLFTGVRSLVLITIGGRCKSGFSAFAWGSFFSLPSKVKANSIPFPM